MIQFFEKEPVDYKDPFGSIHYPVYMRKGDCEYYVMARIENKRKHNPCFTYINNFHSYLNAELDKVKSMLIANDGKYAKLLGVFDDPFDMLNDMIERGHTFTEPKNLFTVHGMYIYEAYTVFHGTRKEISSDFRYSIYDNDMLEKIINKVKNIIKQV